jgi:hypothetical protein
MSPYHLNLKNLMFPQFLNYLMFLKNHWNLRFHYFPKNLSYQMFHLFLNYLKYR